MSWRQNPWDSPVTERGCKRKNKGGKGNSTVWGQGTWKAEAGGRVPSSRSLLPIGNKDRPRSQLTAHHAWLVFSNSNNTHSHQTGFVMQQRNKVPPEPQRMWAARTHDRGGQGCHRLSLSPETRCWSQAPLGNPVCRAEKATYQSRSSQNPRDHGEGVEGGGPRAGPSPPVRLCPPPALS